MSVCVAIRKNGETWIGSDAQAEAGNDRLWVGPKWERLPFGAVMIVGHALYYGLMNEYIRSVSHIRRIRSLKEARRFFWEFACSDGVEAVAGVEAGDGLDFQALLVTSSDCYRCNGDLTVTKSRFNYDAVGSGSEVALGVMDTLAESSTEPEAIVERAVKAAIRHTAYCGGRVFTRKIS